MAPNTWISSEGTRYSPLAVYVPFDEYESGVNQRLTALSDFESFAAPDWDGEGAMAIVSSTVNKAKEILTHVPTHIPAPSAAPGADGTIGMDWENERGTLCIDVGDTSTARFYYDCQRYGAREDSANYLDENFINEVARVLIELFPRRKIRIVSRTKSVSSTAPIATSQSNMVVAA